MEARPARKFVHFYGEQQQELCGSDSVMPFDQRFSAQSAFDQAREIVAKNRRGRYYMRLELGIINSIPLSNFIKI